MTLRTVSVSNNCSSDALFRVWVQAVHDHLAAALTQTTDTGQINLTTVLKPTVANTAAGYEIWRFKDTLQATSPIFLKIEYGSGGSSTGANPMVWVTLGTGSDGVGNLTATAWPGGVITSRRNLLYTSSTSFATDPASNTYFDYLSDGSGFILMLWPLNTSTQTGGGLLYVERTRNADGSANGDGVNLDIAASSLSLGSNTTDARLFLANAGSQPTSSAFWQTPLTLGSATSSVVGTTLYPIPVFTGAGQRLAGPSALIFIVCRNDLVAGASLTMPHYGASRAWIAAGPGGMASGWGTNFNGIPTSLIFRGD